MKVDFLDTEEKLKWFFNDYVKDKEITALDVETDGLNEKTALLFGIGLCMEDDQAYYIPIRDNKKNLLLSDTLMRRLSVALLKLSRNTNIIGHNIIYDVLILKNQLGIDIRDEIYADTILMKHCIDEEPPFGLKDNAVRYLGAWADKAQQVMFESIKANGGSTTKDNLEMWKADPQLLGEYCGWDVMLTMKLFKLFYKKLEEQNLLSLFFEEEVMPLYKECVIDMKDKGFHIDVEYFMELSDKLKEDIYNFELRIQELIEPYVKEKIQADLDEEFPVKPGGGFAKAFAEGLGLPSTKGQLTKLQLSEDLLEAKKWLCREIPFPIQFNANIIEIQTKLWKQRYPDEKYMFNIASTKQLSWLIFNKLGIKPIAKTEKGAPKLDVTTLESLTGEHEFCDLIIEYRKLQKILGTYVEGLINRQYNSVIYGSFLMFGTTSGRFSSRDPNLQNLPRVKDEESNLSDLVLHYTNAIKKGFIAPKGYKIVNADYSQLEPRAFAAASGDKLLQQSFVDKEDLYGSIAKNIWKLDCTANEVKKKYPELRQKAKVVALAVVYGAEAGRISQVLKCEREEAQKIIDDYLNAYPGLSVYMKSCDKAACENGFVVSKFGRIRHLPEAKDIYQEHGNRLLDYRWANSRGLKLERSKFKGFLNNSKNFPIQATAAHIVNRAMIATSRGFKDQGIDGYIAAQVHDEVTCIVREDQAEQAANILKFSMENTIKIEVPLIAEPVIGNNWAESK